MFPRVAGRAEREQLVGCNEFVTTEADGIEVMRGELFGLDAAAFAASARPAAHLCT
jgi:hypothetical protein